MYLIKISRDNVEVWYRHQVSEPLLLCFYKAWLEFLSGDDMLVVFVLSSLCVLN